MFTEQFLLIVSLLFLMKDTSASTYEIDAYYSTSTCTGVPGVVAVKESSSCVAQCVTDPTHGASPTLAAQKAICSSDYLTDIPTLFGSSKYVMWAVFDDANCTEFELAAAILVSGSCQEIPGSSGGYAIASLNDNGSFTLNSFSSKTCATGDFLDSGFIPAANLTSHSCVDGTRWYSSNDGASTTSTTKSASPGLSVGAIVGIIGAGIVSILTV